MRHLIQSSLLAFWLITDLRAADIPCPAALDATAVTLPDVADISRKGLVVGNSELSTVVYSSGNEIRLRISKNDCWDMRINTSENAPLPIIDVAKQSVAAGHRWEVQPPPRPGRLRGLCRMGGRRDSKRQHHLHDRRVRFNRQSLAGVGHESHRQQHP